MLARRSCSRETRRPRDRSRSRAHDWPGRVAREKGQGARGRRPAMLAAKTQQAHPSTAALLWLNAFAGPPSQPPKGRRPVRAAQITRCVDGSKLAMPRGGAGEERRREGSCSPVDAGRFAFTSSLFPSAALFSAHASKLHPEPDRLAFCAGKRRVLAAHRQRAAASPGNAPARRCVSHVERQCVGVQKCSQARRQRQIFVRSHSAPRPAVTAMASPSRSSAGGTWALVPRRDLGCEPPHRRSRRARQRDEGMHASHRNQIWRGRPFRVLACQAGPAQRTVCVRPRPSRAAFI